MARVVALVLFWVFFSLPVAAEQIRVYAASSMTNLVNSLAHAFEQEHKVKVVPVFGSSSSLARQIASGAPADLYISANLAWMDFVKQQSDLAADRIYPLAGNSLVVISSSVTESLQIDYPESWLNLIGDSRLAIGQPKSVPAGIYAKQALSSLGIWKSVEHHLAPVHNVRSVLNLVERGESTLGVVYKTDAKQSASAYTVATIPSDKHDPIVYPVALLVDKQEAVDFFKFLQSPASFALLEEYGFTRL